VHARAWLRRYLRETGLALPARYLSISLIVISVPARDVARILNNESNLKILDKLKARPYYPRELAQEMELSEPFVVRRLKAMEAEDIVEGRWESEGSRKVKRYYLKDVKIEYGREGLKVSSEELPVRQAKPTIDMKKEMLARLVKLPLMAVCLAGIVLNIPVILVAMLVLVLWYTLITAGFFRRYHFTTTLLSIPVYVFSIAAVGSILVGDAIQVVIPLSAIIGLFTVVLIYIMLYQARYYQLELDDMLEKTRAFIEGLGNEPWHVRLFYLPMALKWKINEYFKIV
jgi:DNA-binding transcriptional ArsR family regulator